MTTQEMLAPFRKAITDYKMINDGDKIAVGVSGGKDSMTLLALMKAYQRFSPEKFELLAVTIDMGFTENAFTEVEEYCRLHEINYIVEKTDIAQIIFEERKEKNPCSLCSKMRRGALNTKIREIGFNKLALGHHKDDVLETFLLSFIFEGRLSTFAPVSYMDRSGVSLIRPMIYIDEKNVTAYARNQAFPVVHNPCPSDKHTNREYMKDLVKSLQKDFPFAKERMADAVMHPERYNLWDKVIEQFEREKSKN